MQFGLDDCEIIRISDLFTSGALDTTKENIMDNAWGKVDTVLTSFRENSPTWSHMNANKILADVRRMMKAVQKMKRPEVCCITVFAGKVAYDTLRQVFPEDLALVKIVKCAYLKENECIAVKEDAELMRRFS